MMTKVSEEYLKTIFAENVKAILRERNINQLTFAAMLGTTPTMVSRWLSGTNYPGARTYADICCTLEVPPDHLLKDRRKVRRKLTRKAS